MGDHGSCTRCGDLLDLVCDPTGEHDYLHCWKCWNDDKKNSMAELDKLSDSV